MKRQNGKTYFGHDASPTPEMRALQERLDRQDKLKELEGFVTGQKRQKIQEAKTKAGKAGKSTYFGLPAKIEPEPEPKPDQVKSRRQASPDVFGADFGADLRALLSAFNTTAAPATDGKASPEPEPERKKGSRKPHRPTARTTNPVDRW